MAAQFPHSQRNPVRAGYLPGDVNGDLAVNQRIAVGDDSREALRRLLTGPGLKLA